MIANSIASMAPGGDTNSRLARRKGTDRIGIGTMNSLLNYFHVYNFFEIKDLHIWYEY